MFTDAYCFVFLDRWKRSQEQNGVVTEDTVQGPTPHTTAKTTSQHTTIELTMKTEQFGACTKCLTFSETLGYKKSEHVYKSGLRIFKIDSNHENKCLMIIIMLAFHRYGRHAARAGPEFPWGEDAFFAIVKEGAAKVVLM